MIGLRGSSFEASTSHMACCSKRISHEIPHCMGIPRTLLFFSSEGVLVLKNVYIDISNYLIIKYHRKGGLNGYILIGKIHDIPDYYF